MSTKLKNLSVQIPLPWKLQPGRQMDLFLSEPDILFYGGQVSGGMSEIELEKKQLKDEHCKGLCDSLCEYCYRDAIEEVPNEDSDESFK